MSILDTTAPGQTDTIAFEIALAHPPAKVWRALTEPELLSAWLLPVIGFELSPGAAFAFKTDAHPGWDGTVRCRVLEIEPQRKLSYAWVVGDMALDTVVTFTITPTDAGTRMTIVQSGFAPHQKQNFGGARYGWKLMGGRLVELLAGDARAERGGETMKKTHTDEGESASARIAGRIAELGDWRGVTLGRMRALIKEADPEVVEEWKWMGTPIWSHDGILCTGESYKKVVKLTFAKGAALADPTGLFNASLEGNTRRAIDIHEGEEIDATAFKALVREAIAFNVAGRSSAKKKPKPEGARSTKKGRGA